MPRSKHSEATIIAALQQLDAGRKVADVAREAGVSTYTIYAWKAKYGGMDVSQAQEARQLREENARLKKLVADLSLDKDALRPQFHRLAACIHRAVQIQPLPANLNVRFVPAP